MMLPTRFAALLVLPVPMLVSLCWATASAATTDSSDAQAQLQESALALPPAPGRDQLLKYYVSPTATMEFAVDARSIVVSDRLIVRFTSVIRSPSGAVNISHEGIRCDTYEKKLYATGRADGSWTPVSNSEWRPFSQSGTNRYHATLANDYFCDGGIAAGKAESIVERLRRQSTLQRNGKFP